MDLAEGPCEADGRVISYAGEQDDPRGGGRSRFRWVVTTERPNRMAIEMYEGPSGGSQVKVLEIRAVRV